MTALLPGLTLVPYGVDSWQPSAIHAARQTRAGLEIGAPFPCEAIDCGGQRPLRFNTASYHFDGMPDMTDSGGDAWVYLADLLKRLNRPWDRLAAHFIDRYFAVLEEIVAAYGAELDAELERFLRAELREGLRPRGATARK